MKRNPLVKSAFALAIALAIAIGILIPMSSQAEANSCPRTLGPCNFSHFEVFGTAGGCCMYECPDGSLEEGICFIGL